MNVNQTKKDITRLEAQAAEAQQRFVELMGGLADGSATIDETCAAFRKSGNLQLDAFELKIRLMGDALQTVGVHGLADSLNFKLPMIG